MPEAARLVTLTSARRRLHGVESRHEPKQIRHTLNGRPLDGVRAHDGHRGRRVQQELLEPRGRDDDHVIDSPRVLWRGRLLDLRQGSLRGGWLGQGQHQRNDAYGFDRFRQVHVAVSISAKPVIGCWPVTVQPNRFIPLETDEMTNGALNRWPWVWTLAVVLLASGCSLKTYAINKVGGRARRRRFRVRDG